MVLVSCVLDLQIAIKNAKDGDTITIANNTYSTNDLITVSCNNVSIVAETDGHVFFKGGSLSFVVTGNKNTIRGFQFIYGSSLPTRPVDLFQIRGSYNILEHMNFNGYYVQHYVNIYGKSQYNLIRSCNIQGKPVDQAINGSQIEIQADKNVIGYHKISHCSFQKMIGNGGDFGNEPIRLGEGSQSTFDLVATVEYCVFDNTQMADSESISVKSQRNVIRYNTFRNNQNAMVSFRNGNQNIVYGNFFLGSSGIKIKQASNIYAYNNYFENSTIPVCFVDVSMYPNPDTYENNIVFQHNTFTHCGAITLGTSLSQVDNCFVNNIIYNTPIAAPNNLVAFTGNYDNKKQKEENPFPLEMTNYSTICKNLSVLGCSMPNIPNLVISNIETDSYILLDITGNKRPSKKSIGCSDFFSVL